VILAIKYQVPGVRVVDRMEVQASMEKYGPPSPKNKQFCQVFICLAGLLHEPNDDKSAALRDDVAFKTVHMLAQAMVPRKSGIGILPSA
jgi:hypothetical protein